jgi:hypothetical protein
MQNIRREPTVNENHLLFSEVEGLCPLCTKNLMSTKNGKKIKLYEAAHIYPLNPTTEEIKLLEHEERLNKDVNHIDNFITLCRDCHKIYDKPRTVEEYRKLLSIKKALINRNITRTKYHEYQVEIEIRQVLMLLIQETSDVIFTTLRLDAIKLDDKADKTLTKFTKRSIRNDITDYYLYIREQFRQLDIQYPKTFKTIASQVNSFYNKINKTAESQEETYEILTEWLSKKSENISLRACGIIISFFIQNCEVFDDSSKQSS